MATNYTSPNKTASVTLSVNGMYIGIVKKVDGKQVWVEMPAVSPGFAFGPCLVAAGVASYSSTTAITSDSTPVVTDINQVPAVGRTVLCAFINNSLDEVVVLGAIL